jgi:hypothetical protein
LLILTDTTFPKYLFFFAWSLAGQEVAVWTLVLPLRYRGSDGNNPDLAQLRQREPTMNQPDSIQKSRPGLP